MRLIRYFFLLILLCGNGCYGDDSGYNLEFTGTIVAQTCDVEISSLSQSIDLGQFSVEDFPSTGTTTKFKPFNINLKNCSRGITGSKIWFTGTADSDNPALLALSVNPLVPSAAAAEQILNEYLEVNHRYLPQYAKRKDAQ